MPANPTALDKEESVPEQTAAIPAQTGRQLKAWLPLAANILIMPLLAYGLISFVIQRGGDSSESLAGNAAGASSESPVRSKPGAVRQSITAPLGAKILVNLAGTMGTRYLLASITLVGDSPDLKTAVERNDAALRDAAASSLSSKTIADLEKPGARNLIRTELISVFNNILGQGTVTELYLTEFAVQ
jgi:flagellar protein FliL